MPGMNGRFFCTEECDGCGECYRNCPTGHIRMENGRPVWPKGCLMCAACADVCPIHAIRFGTPQQIEAYRKNEGRDKLPLSEPLPRREREDKDSTES